jgi:DNA repair protein RecN (Recombination protein N)
MLLELRVENLLLIERAELRLGPALNAITGETGAGKTVLAHALDLLLGGKPKPGVVRPGASEAYVEGVFALPPGLLDGLDELSERLPEGEEEIVLGRRVGSEGRTRAFVQGRAATAADLRELGGRLVAFYGQHEHRKLTLSSAQLRTLDAFCGAEHLAVLDRYAATHARVGSLRRELGELQGRAGTRDRDHDLLAFEIEEIETLGPSAQDERDLSAERERLRRVDGLRAASGAGAEGLVPASGDGLGVAAAIAEAERLADAVEGADPELDALAQRMRGLRIEAEDLGAELRRYEEGLEADPARLEEVEARLDLYDRLKRKHGGTVEAVIAHAERCRSEKERLEGMEVALGGLESDLAAAVAEESKLAARVSKARRKAAPELSARALEELAALAMEDATFEVLLEERDELGPAGAERVEFMISPNRGVPPARLRETASGGELSRAMLALMSVANAGGSETLVFDEVDAGIGGQTARAVGERLRRLAHGRQVICITHLPQIASLAERHFRIEKETRGKLARTSVDRLEPDQVVEELCRMLGADTADAGARRHAEELLAAA